MRRRVFLALATLFLVSGISVTPLRGQVERTSSSPSQTAGGVRAAEPKFRLVRSVSGSQGSVEGDQYIIHDPRTVFYTPQDKQVVVYFEWEGPLGLHHLEGLWKNSEGKVVVVSDFDYTARQRRFGAYWSLPLTEGVTPGIWTLEARVDGEVTGAHTFQVVAAPAPASAQAEKPLLSPAEIYRQGLVSTVAVEVLNSNGERLRLGSGFLIAKNLVLTGFEVVDGASSARVTFADSTPLPVEGFAAWDRLQDWTLLKVHSGDRPTLPLAKPNSWQVGDRCFSLDVEQEGSRTIVDGNITGERNAIPLGDRLDLSFAMQSLADGSPIVNEYGEVVGVYVRRSLLPGSASLDVLSLGFPLNIFGHRVPTQERLAVPISLVRMPTADVHTSSFSELAAAQQFTPPLARYRNVSRGTIAARIEREGSLEEPADEKFEFSRQEGRMVVFIDWDPEEKIKSNAVLDIYDFSNRLRMTSKPAKIRLSKGQRSSTAWTLDISHMQTETYRVDVVLGADPVWRSFFKLVE